MIAAAIGDLEGLDHIGDIVQQKNRIYVVVKERSYHKITVSGVEKALQSLGDYCKKNDLKDLSFEQFDSGRLGSSLLSKQIKLYVS